MPTVSVIIPTYNRPMLLLQALDSVLHQTYNDLEVIIVDDGSCEETHLSNAKSLQLDDRVRYMYRKENRGLAAARNEGIRAASGLYVAFLDDDDVWLPNMLEQQVQFISSHEPLTVVCCDFGHINSNGRILNHFHISDSHREMKRLIKSKRDLLKRDSGGKSWYLIEPEALCKILLCYCPIHLSSAVIVKRECLVNVGLFDESLPTCEDWDMLIRLAFRYNFGYVDEVLAYYRAHSQHRLTDNLKLVSAGHLRLFDKIYLAVPDRFRDHLHAHAHQLYFRIIYLHLTQGDFSAAEPIIYTLAQRGGVRAILHLIAKLVVSSPLTAVQSFVRPINESGRKAAVRLALRQLIKITFRYQELVGDRTHPKCTTSMIIPPG